MEGTNFDALGRLTLPVKAADQLGLTENSKLLITVAEADRHILLRRTQEEPQSFESTKEMKHSQSEMIQKPADTWRYIRKLDDKRRVVLPRTMRELLGWTERTTMRIILENETIYLQAIE
ncbi:MAG: AbrB/MazE/SpoVT family DNA-binding domain-containing protein [Candidatus Fimivivens sp.]|nr:AbrB/MazE/SpoVT family DNA-binding domain-containing protein [Candidatus Fimivivens sp.]